MSTGVCGFADRIISFLFRSKFARTRTDVSKFFHFSRPTAAPVRARWVNKVLFEGSAILLPADSTFFFFFFFFTSIELQGRENCGLFSQGRGKYFQFALRIRAIAGTFYMMFGYLKYRENYWHQKIFLVIHVYDEWKKVYCIGPKNATGIFSKK